MSGYIGNSAAPQSADSTNYLPVRQTVLTGSATAAGVPNFMTAGTGLRVTLSAAAKPMVLAFANGFGTYGGQDYVARITANNADMTGADLAANNTNYITADYVNNGSVTWSSTIAPPQYGSFYDQTKQSVLQFGGSAGSTTFLDDFGSTWTAQGGAKVQTNNIKYGSGALGGGGAANVLNGTTDYIKSVTLLPTFSGGWAVRGWVTPTVLPGVGTFSSFWTSVGATGFGLQFGILNTGGTIRFAYTLSSDNATNNIASGVQGTTLPVVSTTYFIELTYDILAGVYRLYVNGAQENSTTSALKIGTPVSSSIGANGGLAANFFTGYIDKPEFLSYCQHPNGTAYTSPAAAPSVSAAGYASSWFDNVGYQMWDVTTASASAGTNPTFTQRNRVFVGEADTSGAAVTATRNYAYQGKYIGPLVAAAAGTGNVFTQSHNIGVAPRVYYVNYVNQLTDQGYVPGDTFYLNYGDNATTTWTASVQRNTITYEQQAIAVVANKSTGNRAGLTAASWKVNGFADRGW